MILHAGLVALRLGGRWRGALITGPSGAGKSDLALRALDHGFRLVADDRVSLWRSGRGLFGRAPSPLAGLQELRGVGVLAQPAIEFAEVVLLIRAAAAPEDPERAPPRHAEPILEVATPVLSLWLHDPAAPAKLRVAIMHLGGSI